MYTHNNSNVIFSAFFVSWRALHHSRFNNRSLLQGNVLQNYSIEFLLPNEVEEFFHLALVLGLQEAVCFIKMFATSPALVICTVFVYMW